MAAPPRGQAADAAFAHPHRLLYGSDWPHAPKARGLHFGEMLDDYALTPEQRLAIERGNALALFSRLA